MPKDKSDKKVKRKIPKWGRKEKHVQSDLGLRNYSADVPLGNTDPTMVRGKMSGGGGGNNAAARSTGRLRSYRGKYT